MEELPFKYIYHCHTTRCGHASGEDEDIVIEAIKQGIKVLCFTDHTPIPFAPQKGTRMDIEQLEDYVNSIKYLKEKYKSQIDIHVALECENFPTNNQYLWDFLKNDVGHIIIGQHCLYFDNQVEWTGDNKHTEQERIDAYVDSITNALNSGLSKYIAHPDLIVPCIGKYDENVEKGLRTIVECAINNDAYIEFNVHGIINCGLAEFGYPNIKFWQMVKKDYPNAKITIGLDVHSLKELNDNPYLNKSLEIIKEIGLTIVDKIDVEQELTKNYGYK